MDSPIAVDIGKGGRIVANEPPSPFQEK